jgi:hypothetical protein
LAHSLVCPLLAQSGHRILHSITSLVPVTESAAVAKHVSHPGLKPAQVYRVQS